MTDDLFEKIRAVKTACEAALGAYATPPHLGLTLEVIEREAILSALRKNGGKKSSTARQLDIGLRTLDEKLRRYRLGGFMGADAQKLTWEREKKRNTPD